MSTLVFAVDQIDRSNNPQDEHFPVFFKASTIITSKNGDNKKTLVQFGYFYSSTLKIYAKMFNKYYTNTMYTIHMVTIQFLQKGLRFNGDNSSVGLYICR